MQEPDAELLPLEAVLPPSMRCKRVAPPDAGLSGQPAVLISAAAAA